LSWRWWWKERIRPIVGFPGLILLALGIELWVIGEPVASPDERLAFWEGHADSHPGYAESQVRLALEYEQRGRYEEARERFEAALAADPDSEAAAIGLNGLTRRLQGSARALAQMQAFVERHPGCRPCRQNLAYDHLELGDPEAARRQIEDVLANETYVAPLHYGPTGSRVDAYLLAGRIHAALGDFVEAASALERARSLAPRDVRVPLARARLELRRQRPRAALEHIDRALALEPGHPRARELRRRALARTRQRASAGEDAR